MADMKNGHKPTMHVTTTAHQTDIPAWRYVPPGRLQEIHTYPYMEIILVCVFVVGILLFLFGLFK